jgi:hypothetical protein
MFVASAIIHGSLLQMVVVDVQQTNANWPPGAAQPVRSH